MRAAALLLLLSVSSAAPGASIRRCEGADGVTIYTDRPCAMLDALDRSADLDPAIRAQPPATGATAAPDAAKVSSPLLRTDCARRADTLLFDLRRALDSGNVNRLAGLYHWPGTGGGAATRVMNRLQDMIDEKPVQVDLLYPDVAPVHDHPDQFPAGTPPEDPIGIRLAYGELGAGPTRQLDLVRHAECWWVSF